MINIMNKKRKIIHLNKVILIININKYKIDRLIMKLSIKIAEMIKIINNNKVDKNMKININISSGMNRILIINNKYKTDNINMKKIVLIINILRFKIDSIRMNKIILKINICKIDNSPNKIYKIIIDMNLNLMKNIRNI